MNHKTAEDVGGSVELAPVRPKLKKPPLYKVVLYNDDYTPMDFVVTVLEQFFHMQRARAIQIMLQVHNQGKAVCGIFTKDVAQTKMHHVNNFAKENDYPLLCQVESL